MTRKRYYHRFLREDDLEQLEEASKYLFAFDPHEVSLKDVIRSDRWFCLAAISAGLDGEQIVGFVAAALGSVKEFPQEQHYLQDSLPAAAAPHLSSSSSNVTRSAASSISDHQNSASATFTDSPDSSSSSSNALALEVVLLGVVPEYRRRGVASRLLKQVKTHARTRGASLMFLHVQTTNTPARSLYQKAGFTQAALLPDYYTFRQDLQQQQQQQQHEPAAAMRSSWGLDEFSGNDAALLVMQLARSELAKSDLHVAEATTVPAAAAAVVTGDSSSSSGSSSKSFSKPPSSSDLQELAAAAAASSSGSSKDLGHWQQQQQQQPLSSSSSSGSDLLTSLNTPSAAESVSAAAAAAARLLLGPAIGLLGLTPKPYNPGLHKQLGRPGELVDLGNDEVMVQVREGSHVYVFDPDEVPKDVVLTDRDRAVLKRQRQQQAVLAGVQQQQQQQQQQHSGVGFDHDHSSQRGSDEGAVSTQQQQQQHDDDHHDDDAQGGSGGGGGGVSGIQHHHHHHQQQQQQRAAAAVSAAHTLHLSDVSHMGQQCSGDGVSHPMGRRQRLLPVWVPQDPAIPYNSGSICCQYATAPMHSTTQAESCNLYRHHSVEYPASDMTVPLRAVQQWDEHWSHNGAQQLRFTSKTAPRAASGCCREAAAWCGLGQQQQRQRQQGTWRALPAVKVPSLIMGLGVWHPIG